MYVSQDRQWISHHKVYILNNEVMLRLLSALQTVKFALEIVLLHLENKD